jgi:carbamoyltransferase
LTVVSTDLGRAGNIGSMGKQPWVLGLAASHNGAVCLMHGDEIVAAVQEERLLRVKRARIEAGLEPLALRYCLDAGGISNHQLDYVVLCAQNSNRGAESDLTLNPGLRLAALGVPYATIGHHLGHAVGAFATAGVAEAAVLVVDGMGSSGHLLDADEQAAVLGGDLDGGETISIYRASGTTVTPLEKHLVKKRRWIAAGSASRHTATRFSAPAACRASAASAGSTAQWRCRSSATRWTAPAR